MIVFHPSLIVGYAAVEEVDPAAVRELGLDIAIMGAADRLRNRLGDRSFRIVFDGDEEFSDTARFVGERCSGGFVVRLPEQGQRIRDFFGAEEVMVKR